MFLKEDGEINLASEWEQVLFSFKICEHTLILFGAVKLKTKQKVCVWSLGTTVDGKVERDRFQRAHDAFYWFTFIGKFGARDWAEERHKMAAENLKRMSIFSGISAILALKRSDTAQKQWTKLFCSMRFVKMEWVSILNHTSWGRQQNHRRNGEKRSISICSTLTKRPTFIWLCPSSKSINHGCSY